MYAGQLCPESLAVAVGVVPVQGGVGSGHGVQHVAVVVEEIPVWIASTQIGFSNRT